MISLNNPLFKNMPYVGCFWHFVICCICVFCICVLYCLTHRNIIFDILEQSSFQKYGTCWVFLALRHMLYLCICVLVYLYICVFVYLYLYICVFVFLYLYICIGVFVYFHLCILLKHFPTLPSLAGWEPRFLTRTNLPPCPTPISWRGRHKKSK